MSLCGCQYAPVVNQQVPICATLIKMKQLEAAGGSVEGSEAFQECDIRDNLCTLATYPQPHTKTLRVEDAESSSIKSMK